MQEEIWKDIAGYEGKYQVSNLGRLKRLSFIDGSNHHLPERIKKTIISPNGYVRSALLKDGKMRNVLIHRLVAEAFLPNPQNLPCVNHKDEVKTNNFVFVNENGTVDYDKSNLEWCTWKYNNGYGTKRERLSIAMTNGHTSKAVQQFSKDGVLIREYPSIAEASRQTGFHRVNIELCCNGKQKQSNGYIWKLKNSEKTIAPFSRIAQYTLDGNIVDIFYTALEASRKTGILRTSISNCLGNRTKTAGGFRWKRI